MLEQREEGMVNSRNLLRKDRNLERGDVIGSDKGTQHIHDDDDA